MLFKVIFVVFAVSETFSQVSKNHALLKAFTDVAETLAYRNHLVTFVMENSSSVIANPASIASLANIPHLVVGFDNRSKNLTLNSSAIVSLESVESLKTFNQRIVIPRTFSNLKQLFIHCEGGTFDEIA